jgi:glycosyltransferase involved in cell wall biosynthesis
MTPAGGTKAVLPMNDSINSSARVRVDGKFFRLGTRKFHVKGVTYGPFAPNSNGEMFASREQTARDFGLLTELGANVIRVYYVPPGWLLDFAGERGIKVLIDVPWPKHLCFLDSKHSQKEARQAVRNAAAACRAHSAVFAYSVVNEISAEIVRWSGVSRVEKFIDQLVDVAKANDPESLCTFASFPPTEFLQPQGTDFACFNVYLHHRAAFESYAARLQTLAGAKPLVLGEFGMDSIREGETRKCESLGSQIESAFRGGMAGTVLFSFTDDWFRGGMQVEDWAFGLTTRDRQLKESFRAVQRQYHTAPCFPPPRSARVSVVIATYNGSRTLVNALESVTRLNYPDYEVILVDDGSTDQTPEIAGRFPSVRYVRQTNQGLSAARNAGIRAATGEIVAFTDDDCRADEDWLHYLIGDLQRGDFAGVGGHNFAPPEDGDVASAVMVSPGGPAHVMVTDSEAEHIPGCNMAFYKWALEEIGMFDPLFRKAGDDVDVCWRMQDCNHKIGFSPAGFVWHYRRSTVRAYLKQQAGYGEAEALLLGKHPEHFNSFGGGIWRGRIYAPAYSGLLLRGAVIYHGIFASGFFQRLYAADPVQPLMFCTSLAYHVFVNVPLLLLAGHFVTFRALAAVSVGVSIGTCIVAAAQANLPPHNRRLWSRPLVALLFFLQPVVRGWSRFKGRLNLLSFPARQPAPGIAPASARDPIPEMVDYWSGAGVNRYQFLATILSELQQAGWIFRADTGWTTYDLEVPAHIWTRLRLTTVTEELDRGAVNFRCRIEGFWSLPAKIICGAVSIAVLVLIAVMAKETPWVWMSLILLPLVCWIFDDEKRERERMLADLIDAAAGKRALVKLRAAVVAEPKPPAR